MSKEIDKEKAKMELASGKYQTNHILHLILTIVTLGWWALPWVYVARENDKKRAEAEEIVYGKGKTNKALTVLFWVVWVLYIIAFIGMYLGSHNNIQ